MKKRNIPFIFFAVLFSLFFTQNCKKLEIEELTKIKTGTTADAVGSNTASVSSTFIDVGSNITEYGHCWSTSSTPTVSDSKDSKTSGAKKGEFTSELSSLDPNTKYYIRPFAVDNDETIYGGQLSFTTLEINYSISITSPTSGVDWQMGSIQDITWTDNISENVNIDLYKGSTRLWAVTGDILRNVN